MTEKIYAFLVRKPDTPIGKEKLALFLDSEFHSAEKQLKEEYVGEPYIAMSCGNIPKTELFSLFNKRSTLENPFQTLVALEFIEKEYEELWTKTHIRQLKGLRDRLIKKVF